MCLKRRETPRCQHFGDVNKNTNDVVVVDSRAHRCLGYLGVGQQFGAPIAWRVTIAKQERKPPWRASASANFAGLVNNTRPRRARRESLDSLLIARAAASRVTWRGSTAEREALALSRSGAAAMFGQFSRSPSPDPPAHTRRMHTHTNTFQGLDPRRHLFVLIARRSRRPRPRTESTHVRIGREKSHGHEKRGDGRSGDRAKKTSCRKVTLEPSKSGLT